jgi:phosphoribosylamine--glycine ligase
MKLLIIGGGAREHALAWKFAQNQKVKKIFVAPGNAGIEMLPKAENLNLTKVEDLLHFATQKQIDLTIVGSEALLVDGIVDRFESRGLKAFGPKRNAAILEGSKAYAKGFMKKYGIKTAAYEVFVDERKAKDYLSGVSFPLVVKASGLAAGKGVIICKNRNEAERAIEKIMKDKLFGDAGKEIVIEEFLEGVEASILSITDGETILPFISAKDHKKIGEGETGLNTGGMGVIAPNPYVNEEVMRAFQNEILLPTLKGIKAEKMDFNGFIFFGLMITKKGVYLLEYNMRLGDPETQAILPLMNDDLLDILCQTLNKKLSQVRLHWKKASSCCIVAASGGYPLDYEKGKLITGLEQLATQVFMAGVKRDDGLRTAGGRVLNVVAYAQTLEAAREKAYQEIKKISFEGMYYRSDI